MVVCLPAGPRGRGSGYSGRLPHRGILVPIPNRSGEQTWLCPRLRSWAADLATDPDDTRSGWLRPTHDGGRPAVRALDRLRTRRAPQTARSTQDEPDDRPHRHRRRACCGQRPTRPTHDGGQSAGLLRQRRRGPAACSRHRRTFDPRNLACGGPARWRAHRSAPDSAIGTTSAVRQRTNRGRIHQCLLERTLLPDRFSATIPGQQFL